MKNIISIIIFIAGLTSAMAQVNKNFEIYKGQREVEERVLKQAQVMISDKCTMYLKISELFTALEQTDVKNKEIYNKQSMAWLRLWMKDSCTSQSFNRYNRELKDIKI